MRFVAAMIFALLCSSAAVAGTAAEDSYSFVDLPTDYQDNHPDWFKQSFNNLPEDQPLKLQTE
ncbi:MAG: hypothetical protein HGA75_07090 [Thiobacillus sp.]|nr:hypothetical protein [Thiobacillus sp.]